MTKPDVQNETWGIVTADEHAAMRLNARTCTRCGMLATVDPIAHESRYGHAPEFWFDRRLHRWDGSQMRFTVIHDNRDSEYSKARPYRVGHHAEAVTEDGRLLVYRPSMAGEVLADFPRAVYDAELKTTRKPDPWPEDGGLAEAVDWAHRTLAEHSRAVAVHIRESHQMFPGTSWSQGPGVQTVRRDETATPEPEPGVTVRDIIGGRHTIRVVRPRQTREGNVPTWLVAAQNEGLGWVTWIVVRERGRLLFTCPRYFQGTGDDNQALALAYLDELA
jgi:hypothetical protein